MFLVMTRLPTSCNVHHVNLQVVQRYINSTLLYCFNALQPVCVYSGTRRLFSCKYINNYMNQSTFVFWVLNNFYRNSYRSPLIWVFIVWNSRLCTANRSLLLEELFIGLGLMSKLHRRIIQRRWPRIKVPSERPVERG